MQPILWAAMGTGFTFLMTALGSALVFFFHKEASVRAQRICLGFAAGVMIAASIWSLLNPAIEEAEAAGGIGWIPAAGGFVLGIAFLVLLDVLLPKIDGFGVCELIRRQSQVPILMLTALDGEEEQLRGFGLDIDDYVTKPFSMPVLLEKIRVILRRRGAETEPRTLRYRDLVLDLDAREVLAAGRPLELTAREFDLLHTLLRAPGRVFTREMLLSKLWGYDFFGDERVVDSHIKNLRHKLNRDYIETVRGVGYRAAKEGR